MNAHEIPNGFPSLKPLSLESQLIERILWSTASIFKSYLHRITDISIDWTNNLSTSTHAAEEHERSCLLSPFMAGNDAGYVIDPLKN